MNRPVANEIERSIEIFKSPVVSISSHHVENKIKKLKYN